jgi:hypothetical protein
VAGPTLSLGCQPEWETGEGDCSTADGGGGCQSRQAGGGEARRAALGSHDNVVNSIRGQRRGVAHRGGCSMAVGSWSEGISMEGVVSGRWWPAVGAGRRPVPGRCSGWQRRGRRRTGAGWRPRGGGNAAPVAPFNAFTSTTMELAWGWKLEEAPVAQLLGLSRRSSTARSMAVDLACVESRGTRRA